MQIASEPPLHETVTPTWRHAPRPPVTHDTRSIGDVAMPVTHPEHPSVHRGHHAATVWPGEPVSAGLAGEEPTWPVYATSAAGLVCVPPEGAPLPPDGCTLALRAGAQRWLVGPVSRQAIEGSHAVGFNLPSAAVGPHVDPDPHFPIVGRLVSPWRLYERTPFRVIAVTPDGVVARLKHDRTALLPGQVVDLDLLVPPTTHLSVQATVWSAAEHGEHAVLLRLVDPSVALRQALGQYALEFGTTRGTPLDPTSLEALGFWVRSLAEACRFSVVELADEYEEVLRLRSRTYGENGKLTYEGDLSALGDAHDGVSRMVTLHHNDRLVACSRLIYPDPELGLEHGALTTLPPQFQRHEEVLEGTRICTDPAYRKGDLLVDLIRYNAVFCVESGRLWMLGCATTSLTTTYAQSGSIVTDHHFVHPVLGGLQHTLLYWDVNNTLLAKATPASVFLGIWRDVSRFMMRRGNLQPGRRDRLRLRLLEFLHPLVRRKVDAAGATPRGRRA